MTIEELCERSYKTSLDKGWHQESRSFGEATALFHSEVSEALEIWRDPNRKLDEVWESEGGKPEGFVIELADLLIRVGDTCFDMKIPLAQVLNNTSVSMLGYGMDDVITKSKRTIPELLSYIHVCLSMAYEISMSVGDEHRQNEMSLSLAKGLIMAGSICRLNGLDLEAALARKMAYNDTRPQRHGGKRG
jgi:NTP pyrophosphatase (non-canonical NTP hydrolase)